MKNREVRCRNCDRLLAVHKGDVVEIKCKCHEYTLITERDQRQTESQEPPVRTGGALTKETLSPTGA